MNHFSSFPQIYDVFTEKTMTLKDSTSFVVSVNPTGVVMWHVSAPAKWNFRHFYKGGRRQGSAFGNDGENVVPPVLLWSLADVVAWYQTIVTSLLLPQWSVNLCLFFKRHCLKGAAILRLHMSLIWNCWSISSNSTLAVSILIKWKCPIHSTTRLMWQAFSTQCKCFCALWERMWMCISELKNWS